MRRGWRYRLVAFFGTAVLTVVAVVVANYPTVHETFARVPYFGRPAPAVLPRGELEFTIVTILVIVLVSMWPLFKPRPRRLHETLFATQKRVLLAMVGLATLGYFNYSYRLPRPTLLLTMAVLFVALPLFLVTLHRRPAGSSRAIIVGTEPEAMKSLLRAGEQSVVGYLSPPSMDASAGGQSGWVADGGTRDGLDTVPCLGGVAQLDELLVARDVNTVLLAFTATDRDAFFWTLEVCHEHSVDALVHAKHADYVLSDDLPTSELLRVNLEPLDWQDHVLKRAFDLVVSSVALLLLTPSIVLISVAIKLDDGGPLLYSQERTAAFGNTFTVYKFRSMSPGTENPDPTDDGTRHVTRVGRVLRETHLDEIPQLWTILTGEMSLVGPRAVWTDEERHLEEETTAWRKRWFIKPGLTGLAQVNNATSADATAKLHYDLTYIRRQSFWFDLKIVVRQVWMVGANLIRFIQTDPLEDVPRRSTVTSKETDQTGDNRRKSVKDSRDAAVDTPEP